MTTRLQVYQPIMIAGWSEGSIIAQGDIKEKPAISKKNAISVKKYLKFFNFLNWIVFGEIIDFDPNKSKPFGWYLMRLFLMELV